MNNRKERKERKGMHREQPGRLRHTMSKNNEINRRQFIAATSAAVAGSGTLFAETTKEGAPQAFRSHAGSLIPFSRQELLSENGPQRTFTGGQLSEIAFPLGGIGTGTVSLGGRGELRDWEIFNRPGKGKILPFSFVALWARPQGGAATVKVIEAPIMPPYRGSFGYKRESAEGLPRFKAAHFTGAYPFGHIEFEDESLPVSVSLDAFNPFVPLNVDDSSLPVAIFHYHVASRSRAPVDVSLAFSLLNAIGYDGVANLGSEVDPGFGKNLTRVRQEEVSGEKVSGLDMTSDKYASDDPRYGSMALLTPTADISARTAWEGGKWWDSFQKWLEEYSASGRIHDSKAPEPTADGRSNYSTLAPFFRLAPGESKTITFVLAWYFPTRENYWNDEPEVHGQKLRNYYGTRFKNAWDVASYTAANLSGLEKKTRTFHDSFFSGTLPPYVLDAVSSQASIIRTNTCMLLEGKQFFAFEGCGDDAGCCPMNCAHVWNYEQALAFLYPELERSMRNTDFKYNVKPDGSMVFRTLLPLGRARWKFKPAADGQMGCIMKLYREWQLSGDTAFLKDLWPEAKRALEFAWVHWDANRDGVMEGQQHNTYDIEFYGPNTMMGTLYLGALRAGELMANAVGDTAAASAYREVREKGKAKLEELWNGEFYIQQVPPPSQIRPLQPEEGWYEQAVSNGEVRYQYGEGCLSDQLLGQWFAEVLGLDPALQPKRIRKTLQSIFRHNFRNGFYDHPNTQRIYALNDEQGLLLCSWPNGKRPALPFVYSDEVWTGIEYQVAAHLIYEGFLEEGLAIVKGIRERYDGARRNPWNEVECGSHYARALASWSVLLALSGYRYSATESHLDFQPRVNSSNFRSFFVAGTGWGTYSQHLKEKSLSTRIEVSYGEVRVRHLTLPNKIAATTATGPHGKLLDKSQLKAEGQALHIDLGEEVTIPAGGAFDLTLNS